MPVDQPMRKNVIRKKHLSLFIKIHTPVQFLLVLYTVFVYTWLYFIRKHYEFVYATLQIIDICIFISLKNRNYLPNLNIEFFLFMSIYRSLDNLLKNRLLKKKILNKSMFIYTQNWYKNWGTVKYSCMLITVLEVFVHFV